MENEKDIMNDQEQDEAVQDETMQDEAVTAEASAEDTQDEAVNAEEIAEGAEAEEGKTSWADKRAAKKAAKVDKEKEALKEQVAALDDKVKRQLAEFENFRNRTEKEKSMQFSMGAKSVLEKILPVVDNFERGLQSVPEDKKEDPYVDGMNRIYKQLMAELENLGVTAIDAVGQPFDPNLHNAVMQAESDELESGMVAQELQKGYMYHDMVLRHSMVSVVS